MKQMKKSVKCLIAVFALILALGVTGISAEAKTKTEKMTLYVGEKGSYTYIGLGTVKSVKSSNSKVVSAKKKKDASEMTAKKAGSATVTVKGTRGTYKYKITVKKADFDVKCALADDNYLLVSVKNKTKGYFDSVNLDFTFKDANGNVLDTNYAYSYALGPGKTGYDYIYLYDYEKKVDLTKTTYKLTYSRSIDAKYKNYDKKVKWSVTKSGDKVIVKASASSYKGKGGIYAGYDVLFYDAFGKVVYVYSGYNYLYKSSKSKTVEITMPDDAVRYEVKKRAFEKVY